MSMPGGPAIVGLDAREQFARARIRLELGTPDKRYRISTAHFLRRPAADPEGGEADAAGALGPLVSVVQLHAVFPVALSTFEFGNIRNHYILFYFLW